MTDSDQYYIPEYVRFVRLDEDRAVLSGPIQNHILEGKSVELVANAIPLLREGVTPAKLADKLSIPTTMAEKVLTQLSGTDLVRPTTTTDNDLIEWVSSRPSITRMKMADITVAVLTAESISTVPPEAFNADVTIREIDTLSSLDEEGLSPDVVLTMAVGVAPEFHRAVLEETWSAGIPWLPIRLVDSELRLGPYSPPGTDACYNCYYQRVVASAPDMEITKREQQERERGGSHLYPSMIDDLAWSFAHMEMLSIAAPDRTPTTGGSVTAIDPLVMETTTTDVLKLPGCKICGTN